MHYTKSTRLLSMILAIVMVVGLLPMSVFATENDGVAVAADAGDFSSPKIVYNPREDDYYKVISKKDYVLAPGITESEIVLNNDAGSHRQVAHVVEVDINNPYTKVIPSTYKMAEGLKNKEYRTQIMSAQAAYAEANGYGNVVAAMNIALSWYNTAYYAEHPELVGEPLGYLVLDGEMYANSQGKTSGAQTCLVINFDEKDGVARPADMPKTEIRSTSTAITGWEEQVIPANFGFLVKDGVNQSSKNHTSDPASRSFIGIKEDGSIIIVMNDGRQAPFSTGFNSYEMAEFMLSLGCVHAVNGDGGGSSAFLSQRPGEELKVNCSPSDGAERDTTHGILVISTAPADGQFVRATVSTDDIYYTPGSSVQFHALGTDLVGTETEIPADADWQLTDPSMGTIENGLFVSNGTVGEVTVQLVYNDAVVGEATINIVVPEIAFKNDTIVIGYGDTLELPLEVTTNEGLNGVTYNSSDIVYTLSDANLGTITDGYFTACNESTGLTEGTITAVICGNTDNTVSATIKFGKASEIAYDFEDGNFPVDTSNTGNIGGDDAEDTGEYINGWHISDTRQNGHFAYRYFGKKNYTPVGMDIPSEVYLVDSSNGLVKNGNYAMGIDIDWTNVTASCHGQMDIFLPEPLDLTDAVSVGFWMYLPAGIVTDSMNVNAGFRTTDGGSKRVDTTIASLLKTAPDIENVIENGGWYYFSWDVLDTYKTFDYIQINSHYTAGAGSYNYYQDITYYVDDITVDYSDATIDRDNPYFTGVTLSSGDAEIPVEDGYTISGNTVTLFAQAHENTTKANYTGLKGSSVKVTVDGQAVTSGVSVNAGGKVSVNDLYLNNGVHTIAFEISDNQGNVGSIVRKIVVNNEESAVRLVVPASEGLIPTGSLYWLELVAEDLANIESVTTTINLDYVNDWELEGMEVAYGFEAEYEINEHNDAVITFNRVGEKVADTSTLAKLPVRIWMAKGWMDDSGIRATYISDNPSMQDKYYILTPHAMWYSDGTRDYRLAVGAEAGIVTYVDGSSETFSALETVIQTEMNRYYSNSDKQNKWSFHICTAGDAQNLDATCTTPGYTGRVFCTGCACGTLENLGHECDNHNGCGSVIEWGTTIPATGHTYKVVEGKLACDCGDVLEVANGLVTAGEKTYYAVNGELVSGWIMVDDDWYYFDETTYEGLNGAQTADKNVVFQFENGRLTAGAWEDTEDGKRYWYGPSYYRDQTNDLTSSRPYEIDGKLYLFNRAGYMQTGVVHSYVANGSLYYYCEDSGIATLLNGPHNECFYENGVKVTGYKLVKFEDSYYFVNGGVLTVNKRGYLSDKFVGGTPLKPGYYDFDDTGKILLKNGPIDGYFYENGLKVSGYKLVKFEDNYYFLNGGILTVNKRGYLSEKFVEGTDLQPGYYEFDETGKILLHNGPIDGYFYVNGIRQTGYKLVEFEGNYYFVNGGVLTVSKRGYLSEKFVEGTDLQPGYYEFDETGKILLHNGPIDGYFYVNGIRQTGYKLVEFEGNYYFVNGEALTVSRRGYLSAKFVAGTSLLPGYYEFDEIGKILLHNGPVDGYFYVNGIRQTGYKLVEFEGDYYFINGEALTVSKRGYLSDKFVAGTSLKPGYYEFDADGKMIIN